MCDIQTALAVAGTVQSYREQKVQNAHQADVKYMQTICTKISEFSTIENIANQQESIFCSVGTHPNNVANEKKYIAEDKSSTFKNSLFTLPEPQTSTDGEF